MILKSGIGALAPVNHDADEMQTFEKSPKAVTRKSIDIEEYVVAKMVFHQSVACASKMLFWSFLFPS